MMFGRCSAAISSCVSPRLASISSGCPTVPSEAKGIVRKADKVVLLANHDDPHFSDAQSLSTFLALSAAQQSSKGKHRAEARRSGVASTAAVES